MTRHPGRDEAGRPIVAELGRAETPEEIAARRAEASAKRVRGMNTLNLVIALFASLAVVMVIVMIVVRPDAQPQYPYAVEDYATRTAEAAEQMNAPYIAPVVPDTWFVNRAEFRADPGVTSWEISYITDNQHRLTVIQTLDANPTWLADTTARAEDSHVIELDGFTIVLVGAGDDEEVDLLVDAIEAELAA